MSDAVDLIQGSMYGISGGVLELMRTGEIDQGFKQFLSEIRHSWDDDYTPDPDSWFNRPVYNAEWGQILRSNDGIIGKKLLDAIDTNPFLAFMDAKTIDDLTDISAIDPVLIHRSTSLSSTLRLWYSILGIKVNPGSRGNAKISVLSITPCPMSG